jgi:hypothetical protein
MFYSFLIKKKKKKLVNKAYQFSGYIHEMNGRMQKKHLSFNKKYMLLLNGNRGN